MSNEKFTINLTENEWVIMKILWGLKSCLAKDVYRITQDKNGWAITTTKTYLKILTNKGYLTASRVGKKFIYEPRIAPMAPLRLAADEILENTIDGCHYHLLVYIISNLNFTADEINNLICVLDAKTVHWE